MNTTQLGYFIAIARHGSLTAAAAELGVAKQTLSKYLSELNDYYGLIFFERKGNRLELTEAGRVYLKAAREIRFLLEEVKGSIESSNQMNTIRVGVTKRAGIPVIVKAIPEFMKEYPNILVQAVGGQSLQHVQDVETRKLDIAFGSFIQPSLEGFQTIPIFRSEIVLAVSPQHPLYHEGRDFDQLPVVSMDEIRKYTFIVPAKGMGLPYDFTNELLKDEYNSLGGVIEVKDTMLLDAYVGSNLGVSFTPFRSLEKVGYLRLEKPVYVYHMAVLRKDRVLTEADKRLIDLYVKEREAYDDFTSPY